MSIRVPLSKPVMAHGEEIAAIELRQPETKDVIKIGLPTLIVPSAGGEAGVEIRQAIVARYIVVLGGVPMSTVESLSLADHSALTAAVMSFFGQGGGEASNS